MCVLMTPATFVAVLRRIGGGLLMLTLAGSAGANPTGQSVVNGTVTFAVNGSILTVTNSPNAIINWSSFSIGTGELTRFIQQSAASSVLNRVIGQDPSAILGALQSNGRVFLVNPNGILFGNGAQIDVAGLVASTLNLSNEDFLSNRLRFTGGATSGSVVNQGAINASSGGNVYLIGKRMNNEGLITSPNGEVVLAAGNSVELVDPGSPNLRVEVVAPDNEARNLGQIAASSGRIGIYAGLIRVGGTIDADRAVNGPGGTILLKAGNEIMLNNALISAVGGSIVLEGQASGNFVVTADVVTNNIPLNNPGPIINPPAEISVNPEAAICLDCVFSPLRERALFSLENLKVGGVVQIVPASAINLLGRLLPAGGIVGTWHVPVLLPASNLLIDIRRNPLAAP